METLFRNVYGGSILGKKSFIKEALGRLNDSLLGRDDVPYRREPRSSVEAKDITAILSKHFGGVSYSAISQVQRRLLQKASKDKSLRKESEKLEKVISHVQGLPPLFKSKERIMRIILFVLAIFAFIGGAAILTTAKSAAHEIEGLILLIIFAVFLSGAGIVEAINLLKKEMPSIKNG